MTTLDFAVLPPEVNSARMYAGPGAGPLVAAATAWDGLAAELSSATAAYQQVVVGLTDEAWQGPSAAAMAAAAAPYLEWMGATAAQAEQAANQARAAAAAYEVAFAATVPPPVVTANRTLLQSLVSNNVFGQNSSAIAANQAEYAQMWAQDASAMYGYASSSAAATKLAPFTPPKQNSNAAAQANQGATSAAGNPGSAAAAAPGAVPGPIQSLIDGYLQLAGMPLFSSMNQLAGSFGVTMVNVGGMPFMSSAVQVLQLMGMLNAGGANGAIWGAEAAAAAALPAMAISSTSPAAFGATLAGSATPVSAGLGGTPSVGGLSVPQAWGTATGAMGAGSAGSALAGSGLPGTNLAALPATAALRSGGWSGERPMVAGLINAPRSGASNGRFKYRVGMGPAVGGKSGGDKDASGRWLQPSRRVADSASALSSHERRELEGLRNAVGDLTTERDAAARLIRKELRS